ncbi:hypothetical protein RHGRI_009848 [Rhododendron griersonianum]|uniref:Uncharacterized protein n=1 Tax=Rhododendron griersonianum TaxID=479676 RepID=A0AAV6KHI3_9ERIC|nr:hypothetical protein RHGRI_009848 [Rhododendron griersonianum]
MRLSRSNTPVLISKHPDEDNLLFFHPRTQPNKRHSLPGIPYNCVNMYNVNTEEYRDLPRQEVGLDSSLLISTKFSLSISMRILFLHIRSHEIGQDMWFDWKQGTTSHSSFISGFIYGDNHVYWLDMVGIHMFDLEDEGNEVINQDIHGQAPDAVAQGCLIMEDETTFDLLTLQAHLRLNQINLNLETITIMEKEIDSLGATCIYSIDNRGHTRDKRTGYRLPAEVEWDTDKLFL